MSLLTVDALADAILKTRAERSLRFFLEHIAWPVIEPQTVFHGGWHIDAMCDHAAALVNNQIRNLLITVPPRHTKSIIASVAHAVVGVDGCTPNCGSCMRASRGL